MISWSVLNRFLALRREKYVAALHLNKLSGLKNNFWKEYKWLHVSSVYFVKTRDRKVRIEDLERKRKLPVVNIWNGMTITELANALDIDPSEISKSYFRENADNELVLDSVRIASGFVAKFNKKCLIIANPNEKAKVNKAVFVRQPPPKPENLVKRPPVVTVMGHVDHGKTTLLDALRNTFVAQQEFGGITQHIGAFSVQVKKEEKITFIDTPGHAAFTAMRSRGAEVTDFVILVVAADDGVMDQTVESIRIINNAQVPMIVAVNKIDKPTAMKVEDIKNKLLEEGVQVEDRGGDIQLVPISALKKINLDLLVDTILLEAEVMNLTGDPKGLVEGVVIEAKVDKMGIVATVIIKRGTLKKGKFLISGLAYAKVRVMLDENRQEYNSAPPSTPVQIFGWKKIPTSGDEVFEVATEKEAIKIIRHREKEKMNQKQEEDYEVIREKAKIHQEKHHEEIKEMISLPSIKSKMKFWYERKLEAESKEPESSNPTLNVILKGDVHGTVEVLSDVLGTYGHHDECQLSIVSASVGNVSLSDLEMAEAFDAIIYAFNVDPHPSIQEVMSSKSVDIRYHNVLYKLIDDLKSELNLRIPPVDAQEIHGEAEVLQQFDITHRRKKVPVAGCKCTKGQLRRDSLYAVKRGDEVLFEGKMSVMKQHKNEVKVVQKGNECGLMLESFSGKFEPGDVIICYDMIKVPRQTSWNPGF